VLAKNELEKRWILDVWDYDNKKVATIGANGSAKSTYNFRYLFALCVHEPISILITSGTYQQVTDLFKQKLYPLLKVIGFTKANYQTMEFTLTNGVELHFKTSENFRTAEGVEYDAWFADEFQLHSREAVEMFHRRTRRSKEQSIFRIVGLPDEPDSWQYTYFEENGYTLNEISLYDHPSQEWIAFYEKELKKLFPQKEKLDRYLYGKRVSLTGIGLFAIESRHLIEVPYSPDIDIEICFDFNSEYRAVTMWQQSGIDEATKHPLYNCVRSLNLGSALTTIGADAIEICEMLKGHKANIILNGDASGENRQIGVTGSMWKAIREEFNKQFVGKVRFVVPSVNPLVKDTIQCVNWALSQNLVSFSTPARKAFQSVTACKADKYGEIDKSVDYTPSGVRTHHADTVRYSVWRIYSKLYPSGRNRYAIYA
jgi:hypothetical protein